MFDSHNDLFFQKGSTFSRRQTDASVTTVSLLTVQLSYSLCLHSYIKISPIVTWFFLLYLATPSSLPIYQKREDNSADNRVPNKLSMTTLGSS